MQCYEYLAIHEYARRHLAEWAEKFDDLELAEKLDEHNVDSFEEVKRMGS